MPDSNFLLESTCASALVKTFYISHFTFCILHLLFYILLFLWSLLLSLRQACSLLSPRFCTTINQDSCFVFDWGGSDRAYYPISMFPSDVPILNHYNSLGRLWVEKEPGLHPNTVAAAGEATAATTEATVGTSLMPIIEAYSDGFAKYRNMGFTNQYFY